LRLALDTSVLLTVFNQEPGAEDWMETLIQARRQGQLVLCEVVYAELAPAFGSHTEFEKVLDDLGASRSHRGRSRLARRPDFQAVSQRGWTAAAPNP